MKDWHPAHTPWDGSHPLFRIGLNRLDLDNWIEVDAKLAEYRAQKAQLLADNPGGVWFAEPETIAAQREVLALLSEHLVRRFPMNSNRHRKATSSASGSASMSLRKLTG